MIASELEPQPTTTKKVISFNNRVKVRKTLHISDFTNDEVQECWYNCREKDSSRRLIRSTLNLMKIGDSKADDGTECGRRGLECFTAEGMEGRKRRRNKAKLAVFDEQDRQYDDDEDFDDERIAKAYSKYTKSSRDIAVIMGMVDERVAMGENAEKQESVMLKIFSVARELGKIKQSKDKQKRKVDIVGRSSTSKKMSIEVSPSPISRNFVASHVISSAA